MAEEPQLQLHKLLAAAESESSSISETSLSSGEATTLLEENEKADQASRQEDSDIEKGENGLLQSQKKRTSSLHFLGWTVVNTLATIGIVRLQSRSLNLC